MIKVAATRGWSQVVGGIGIAHLWVALVTDGIFFSHCKATKTWSPMPTTDESIRCKNCLRSIEAFRALHLE